ncbi:MULTISPECIES: hypothetical protein [unclassified Spirosoma]|mgnify:CR=1 FL=1|uniref:hypothetical protein n=1 Tax=unclassified Spirosoma TaxID=2621999 RepID=UPI000963A3CE|nr:MULTISPECIES: hypothetical protein [unclassified Spirosoma]MBN8821611.1 hypothetical protein [Spirosoma sp.]OJW78378.1 MAG: hypothetical protein BGO59_30710 [Spirosoma sp. 48-14]
MNQSIIYYGVDVSKEHLHISYPMGTDAKEQPQWSYQTLPNELDQLEQWVVQLPPNSHLIFEHTGTYSARLAWVL